jgi:hypothetical protein
MDRVTDALQPCLMQALETVEEFVEQITGQAPTQKEMASALKRYFVLNEIMEHIEMDRQGQSSSP